MLPRTELEVEPVDGSFYGGQFNEKFPKNCSCSTKEQVSLRSSVKSSLILFRLESRSKRFNLGFMGPENVLKTKESK